MRGAMSFVAAGFVCLATTTAAAQTKDDPATMPLRKVRLYETGVAYFEREGALAKGISLPVPAGHLDDALKTLVVLSEDGDAAVDGVEFSSSVSRDMGLALAGLKGVVQADGDEREIDYAHLLDSLEGAPVEVRSGGQRVRGRLVDVEAPPSGGHRVCTTEDGKERCRVSHHQTLTVITDGDEVRRFSSDAIDGVKPTDPAFRARLGSALDALSQRGAQTSRKLRVLAKSSKPVTLGYIAESPVWRSTYRLVLASKDEEKNALQGWALLHNDTDEPWKQVKVELVNGRPDSFLYPLAAPRYARRQLVTPDRELSTVPQLLDKTVDNMWDPISESFGAGGLGLSGVGEGGGGTGEGIGLGSIGTIGHGAGTGTGTSGLLGVGNLANLAAADGVEAAAMFRYALERPIDLRAHGSALLPFLSATLDVTSIAYVKDPGQTARTAVHLKNTTRQTLPAGPISVFADGGFAGETGLSRTKPGESRILTFGLDLDLELDEVEHDRKSEPKVVVYGGARDLVVHFMRHHEVVYGITNRSGRGRRVYMPLRFTRNADVQGADALSYDEESNEPLAVLDVNANAKVRRTLRVREGLQEHLKLDMTTAPGVLERLAKSTSLSADTRATLRKSLSRLERSAEVKKEGMTLSQRIDDLDDERDRLREDLEALGRDTDAHEELADKVLALETKRDALRAAKNKKLKAAAKLEERAFRALEALKPPKKSP